MTKRASSQNGSTEPSVVSNKKLSAASNKQPSAASSDKQPSAASSDKQSFVRRAKQNRTCHAIFWWSLKVSCGTILIAALFIGVLYELNPWFVASRTLAQALVVIGGASAIFHYLRLKSLNKRFERPDALETEHGLYRRVRHPMYFSDCLTYIGLFLLFPTIATAIVLGLGVVSLVQQSKVEDRYLAERFGQQFSDWRDRSKLIVPFIY
jgi:protein-S-isoprenylcysteine O-methyltransferase Ste14